LIKESAPELFQFDPQNNKLYMYKDLKILKGWSLRHHNIMWWSWSV